MTRRRKRCQHLAAIAQSGRGAPAFCEDCLAEGTTWLSLRICLSCGHVNCGEDSPGDHATKHYAETDHPIAALAGTDSQSRWCYADGCFV